MRLKFHPRSARSAGYALLITMVFVGILLTLFASVMYWTMTNAKITKRNNLFNQSEAAAESAVEVTLASMMRDYMSQDLNPAGVYATNVLSQTGWPIRFQISDTNNNPGLVSVSIGNTNWTSLPNQYAGLSGSGRECVISARAMPLNQGEFLSAPISEKIWFGRIPVFQFAIFYNIDLEINPGAGMKVTGKVHSNQNLYATGHGNSDPLSFSDVVEAAGQVQLKPKPGDPQNSARSGNVKFTLTANNPSSNVNSLNLPVGGTNRDPVALRAILGLPPYPLNAPNDDAYSSAGQDYIYNKADIIISNGFAGTNLTVYYHNGNRALRLDRIAPDITNIVTSGGTTTTNTFYSFVTNVTFYDFRESCYVKAVQIDVGNFRSWLTNQNTGGTNYDQLNYLPPTSKGHRINGLYVYNSVPFIPATTSSDGQLPAVRAVNGARLPQAGLTIASAQPIYVKGSYNVTTNGVNYALTLGSTTNGASLPAAFLGDAVTILSANWDDNSKSKGLGVGQRGATDTTINAACFEGIVPTGPDSKGNGHYSGGVENFLRLLENWSGKTLTYNGSIVVMFPSQYAINYWSAPGNGAANFYEAPDRQWGFDTTFYDETKLPPMAPDVKAVLREAWMAQ